MLIISSLTCSYLGVSAWAKTDAGIGGIVSTSVVIGIGLLGAWDNRRGRKHQLNEIQSILGTKVQYIGSRVENIEQRVGIIEQRVENIEQRVGNIDQQIESLRTVVDENHQTMMNLVGGTAYNTMKALDGDKASMRSWLSKNVRSQARVIIVSVSR